VVVGSWGAIRDEPKACPLDAIDHRATLRLAAPLGNRPVLDVTSGQPMLQG
jgi:hypothetical protein